MPIADDHQLENSTYPILRLVDDAIESQDVSALSALNMRRRDDYVADSQSGLSRWNKVMERHRLPAHAAARRL